MQSRKSSTKFRLSTQQACQGIVKLTHMHNQNSPMKVQEDQNQT